MLVSNSTLHSLQTFFELMSLSNAYLPWALCKRAKVSYVLDKEDVYGFEEKDGMDGVECPCNKRIGFTPDFFRLPITLCHDEHGPSKYIEVRGLTS